MPTTNFSAGTSITSTWLNEVDAATFDGAAVFTPAGTGAVTRTAQAKMRESVSVLDFGAVGDGIADDTVEIQAAMDASNSVFFPRGIYLISSTLLFSRSYQRLFGDSMGGYYSAAAGGGVEFKWNGAAAGTMMRVPTGTHGPQIEGLAFNANDLANHCVHLDVRAGSSIQFPYLNKLAFRGYRDAALILGENDRSTTRNGALQLLSADHLTFWGGGAGATAANVCGVLLNAQNCEFASAKSWYFDPFTSVGGGPYIDHYYHIYAKSGGLNIQGLSSTRCALMAIYSGGSQVAIDGWRSEDPKLFETVAAELEGPCVFTNLMSRGGSVSATDVLILFNGIESALLINGAKLNGSITLGATSEKYFSANALTFTDPACVITYNGPQNVSGMVQNATTGATTIRGSGAALSFKTEAGTELVSLTTGALYTPRQTITQLTANAAALALGNGQFFAISGDAARDVQGIVGSAGRNAKFYCTGSYAITFKHQSGTAAAADRLTCLTGADIVLAVGEMCEMVYDASVTTWRVWKL